MREQDMRRRIEQFMAKRLRSMLLPATLGLGLAVAGCDGDGLSADDGGLTKDAAVDTRPAVKYMAQLPDSGPEVPTPQPEYMAQVPDASLPLRYAAPMFDGGAVPIYMAIAPRT